MTRSSQNSSLYLPKEAPYHEPQAENRRSPNRSLLPSTETHSHLTGKRITPSSACEARSHHYYMARGTTAAMGAAQLQELCFLCNNPQQTPQCQAPAQPLTYFCSTINIFNGKHLSQSIEENFGKSWHQLGGCDQDVLTVFPERRKTLVKAHLRPVVPGPPWAACSASQSATCFTVLPSRGLICGFGLVAFCLN